MGAFFGAVSRVPMTGIVIIFEMTADFNLVLPLMISAIVAYFVAEQIQPGSIYDQLLLERQTGPKAPEFHTRILDRLNAADIMQRRVETLSSQCPSAKSKKPLPNLITVDFRWCKRDDSWELSLSLI